MSASDEQECTRPYTERKRIWSTSSNFQFPGIEFAEVLRMETNDGRSWAPAVESITNRQSR